MTGRELRVTVASEPGTTLALNEDWACATSSLLVVLDGATVRTETGCHHGVAWYVRQLGAALVAGVDDGIDLREVLARAIEAVAALHPECDLSHPGTPSAAVAIVHVTTSSVRHLVLGDVTVVLDQGGDLSVIVDDRVSATAVDDRALADRYAIGSGEKAQALLRMKRGELAARNQPDGYWIAAADPGAARHALVGERPGQEVDRLAVLTDGAARVAAFGLLDWSGILDFLAAGRPRELLGMVREAEAKDAHGETWPRNKQSDDATVVYAEPVR